MERMLLEMYLDWQIVDTTTVVPLLWQMKPHGYVKSLVAELEKKHAGLLKKAVCKPGYCLSGVPSCINDFTPLRHPDAPAQPIQTVETTVQPPAEITLRLAENMPEAGSAKPIEKMASCYKGKVA